MEKAAVLKAIANFNTDEVRKALYNHIWEESNIGDSVELVNAIIEKMKEAGETPENWNLIDKVAFIANAANINGFMNGYELGVQAAMLALDDISD